MRDELPLFMILYLCWLGAGLLANLIVYLAARIIGAHGYTPSVALYGAQSSFIAGPLLITALFWLQPGYAGPRHKPALRFWRQG